VSERTTIHLLRHGEVHNPEQILYGRLPGYDLSDLGRRMAEVVAGSLSDRNVTELISSPMERARQTAQPLAAAFGLPVDIDERLIEASNLFQGQRFGHGSASPWNPLIWWRFRNPWQPSWGEPYVQIASRMLDAVADARQRARGSEAVLVSHQLPIWTVRSAVERRRLYHDPRHRSCALASLTSLVYEGDTLHSVTYSEPAVDLLPREGQVPGA
jgi:broad specificity phosphatase PhoE